MKEKVTDYPGKIKWTKQRKEVYHILLAAKEPMSATQIYGRLLQDKTETVHAISTVYRILSTFEEQGFVEAGTFPGDGTTRYEWKRDGHRHYAVCLKCHKRVALHACPFEHLSLEADAEDFVVTGHKLELYGYCKDCEENSFE